MPLDILVASKIKLLIDFLFFLANFGQPMVERKFYVSVLDAQATVCVQLGVVFQMIKPNFSGKLKLCSIRVTLAKIVLGTFAYVT